MPVRLWTPQDTELPVEALAEDDQPWLWVTDVKQYMYCPRILYFLHTQPVVYTPPPKVEEGEIVHDELRRRLLRRWPRSLPQGEVLLDVPLADPERRLRGRVDALVRRPDGSLVVVDFKNARTVRPGWKVQLALYGLLAEAQFAVRVKEGYVFLVPRRKAQRIPLSPVLRRKALAALEAVRAIVFERRFPRGTQQKGRCVACEFRHFCNDRF